MPTNYLKIKPKVPHLGDLGGRKMGDLTHKITLLLLLFLLLITLSCRHNRLKTKEKELAKEILIREKENVEAERIAREKEFEMKKSFQGSLRKKEIRSVDPQSPPIPIDIPGTQNNIRKFKLSDVGSSIRYVKLQTPPDTLLLYDHFYYRPDLESIIRSDGEQIIFQGLFGLTRFNMQGEYQETIWKNETGIRLIGKVVMFGGKDFFGVMPHIPVSLLNGSLYFNFHDGPSGNGQVMKYKPGTQKSLSAKSQTEIPGQSSIPGDTLFNKNQFSEERFRYTSGIGPDTWAGVNNEWNSGRTGTLIVTFNGTGDTICQFSDYDRIINFTASQTRRAVELVSYSFNGQLTIKPEYNDTVFRLIPPDRLLPVYKVDFGKFKVSYMDGLNANIDLSDKYILNSLHETNDFLLLRYTRNNDSPNNRKKNAVKFYNTFYDKKEGKIFHQPGFTLVPEGLVNDLDGGMPFWPDFVTPGGDMMKLVSGKVMKDYVNSSAFKGASISSERRQKLTLMASGLKPTDMIIIIVK
jgi:hypothetical protein